MKTETGEIGIDVSPNDIMERLKDAVQMSQGIPMNQYNLVFNNRILDDDRNLVQNGLRNGNVVYLVPLQQGKKFIGLSHVSILANINVLVLKDELYNLMCVKRWTTNFKSS